MRDPEAGRRPVEHDPATVDPLGQQCGVLVLGVADDPAPLDGREVLRRREIHHRPLRPKGRTGDHEALQLLDPDRARVLEAPLLALDSLLRCEQRLLSDTPAVDAVRRARDREVRDSGERLDAREQNGFVADGCSRRIEDRVHGNRPVLRREQRISGVARKELAPN